MSLGPQELPCDTAEILLALPGILEVDLDG